MEGTRLGVGSGSHRTRQRRLTSASRPASEGVVLPSPITSRSSPERALATFAALFDRHGARAFRVARAICGDSSQAEDAVREGFLAIWRDRADRPDRDAALQASLMRLVRERAIDRSGRGAARAPAHRDEAGDRSLLGALRRLPEAQAEVIVLAVFGDLTAGQIAEQLDLPVGSVEGRMRLGLESLRDQMIAVEQ